MISLHLFNVPPSSSTDPLPGIEHPFSSVGFTGNDQVGSIPSKDIPSPRDPELLQGLSLTYFHEMCSRCPSPGMQEPPGMGQAVSCIRGQWPPLRWKEARCWGCHLATHPGAFPNPHLLWQGPLSTKQKIGHGKVPGVPPTAQIIQNRRSGEIFISISPSTLIHALL